MVNSDSITIFFLAVKADNKEKLDINSSKTDKINNLDKKEEQLKKDNNTDKNQKQEMILKNEEKIDKLNDKANEKPEKVDKPEKTNKDEKKEEEKKPAEKKEEKGGKGTAKSPTGNGSKTVPSTDSKSKVSVFTHQRKVPLTHTSCKRTQTVRMADDPVVLEVLLSLHSDCIDNLPPSYFFDHADI